MSISPLLVSIRLHGGDRADPFHSVLFGVNEDYSATWHKQRHMAQRGTVLDMVLHAPPNGASKTCKYLQTHRQYADAKIWIIAH
jgi:hypothetical protein